MKELITRSFEAIKKRGLINEKTKPFDFIDKIAEEVAECIEALHLKTEKEYIEELSDVATVCFMQIKHLGYDPVEEFKKVVEKNEKRANEVRESNKEH